MEKDANRREHENHWENYTAVSVYRLGQFDLLFVLQDCRDQNFNKRKEDEQGAYQNESIKACGVGQTRQLSIDGEAVGNQGEHGGNGDADLRTAFAGSDPKNGPRHGDDKNEREDDVPNVVLHLTRGGELEGVT